ncbi:MAG: electron transfer flavoprotein subunit alpha/FixB family protein, partial [Sneathiella sp.]
MSVLVLADHDNSALGAATLNSVTAAGELGGDVHVLVAGSGCSSVADEAANVSGVSKVILVDDGLYANSLAENTADLIVSLAGGYDAVVAAATTSGKNILPRVAALLDVAQISEITEIVSADTFVRPIYAGNAMATVQSGDAKKVITIRTTNFAPAEATGGSATIEAGAA